MANENYLKLVEALMFTKWQSVSDLMEKTELGPRTIRAFLDELWDGDYLDVKKVGKKEFFRYQNADEEMEDAL